MQIKALCNRMLKLPWPRFNAYLSHCSDGQLIVKTMRLTFVLTTFVMLHVAAKSTGQSVTYSGKDVTLEKVFSAVEQQTGYLFFYNKSILAGTRAVTVKAAELPLEAFLKDLLKDQPLEYYIKNKTIFVSRKLQPSPVNTPPPPQRISGTVRDSAGMPLAGVSIRLTPGVNGAYTNANGEFAMENVTPGNYLLEISAVGRQPIRRKILVTEDAPLELGILVLHSMIAALNEVSVVSTGYQKIPAERATGSFAVLTEKDIESRPSPNILSRLEGMVSGMQVNVGQQDRNLVKNHDQFAIRGVNTILSEKKPLIILDGFPTELDLVSINPSDIERITVLKDAAAASIWGVRAGNGVLVIDTKKGRFGAPPAVNFSATMNVTGSPRIDMIPTASSADFLSLEKELVDKGILPRPSSPLILSYPSFPQGTDLYLRFRNGQITQQQLDAAINDLKDNDVRGQYNKYILRAPISQQYNVSISGGSSTMRNYLGASYADEFPSSRGDYGRRFTVNFNNETRFLERFTFSGEAMFALLEQKYNGLGTSGLLPGSNSLAPYDQIVDANGNGLDLAMRFPARIIDSLQGKGYLPWRYNFLDEIANADNTARTWSFRLNTGLRYDIIPSVISAEVKYMMERSTDKTRQYYSPETYTARNTINTYTDLGTHVLGVPKGGILNMAQSEQSNYTVRGTLDFSPNFGMNSRLDMLIGTEIRETLLQGNNFRAYGYDDRLLTSGIVNYTTQYNTADGKFTVPNVQGYTDQRDRYTSVFGNFTYTYKEKYSVSGSVRKDDSNLFGISKEYKNVPLWSAGAMWRAASEGFIAKDWLNTLNFRMTYGYNGNINKSTSPFLVTQAGGVNQYNQLPFTTVFNPANPQLRWEKVGTFNVGMDVDAFNNRLSANIDVYWKRSSDLLGTVTVNPTYGFTSILANRLEMKNNGIDVQVSGTIIAKKDLTWRASANFSYNTNKVTRTYFQQNNTSYYLNANNPVQGQQLGTLYVYRFAGLDQNGTAMIYDGKGTKVASDLNTLDATDLGALVTKGVLIAPYFGGMSQQLTYKSFELSTLITYKFGHQFIRPTVEDYYTIPYSRNSHSDIGRRWEKPGDELVTNVPAVDVLHMGLYRYRQTDLFVEDAGYARWKELALTYRFKPQLLQATFLKGLAITATGQNLALWTKNKEGIDPDYIPSAGVGSVLPPARSIILTVRANW